MKRLYIGNYNYLYIFQYQMNIAFISGHINISDEEFNKHYTNKIDEAINNNHKFVIGNANGADSLAFSYLLNKGVDPKNITIYYYVKYPNNNIRKVDYYKKLGANVVTGFTSYTDRDKNMTLSSDYDIAWVRQLEESKKIYKNFDANKKSGTQLNLDRRSKFKNIR